MVSYEYILELFLLLFLISFVSVLFSSCSSCFFFFFCLTANTNGVCRFKVVLFVNVAGIVVVVFSREAHLGIYTF